MPHILYILLGMDKNSIRVMPTNKKLYGANYDLRHIKVQFVLNDGDIIELLTSSISTLIDKDVTISKQCQESLKAYQA